MNDLNAGKVELLLILGANPVYDAPADFEFAAAITKAKLRVHSGLYNDETAELCHWHAPAAHYLESWSDTRAYDGTVGIVQPLIAPLYDGHSAHELIALLTGDAGKSGHDMVRDYWQTQRPEKGRLSKRSGRRRCMMEWWQEPRCPRFPSPLRADFVQAGSRASSLRRCERAGNCVPARSGHWRRRIREQQLAAGTAEADYAAHVGQRGSRQRRHGAALGVTTAIT